MLVVATYVQILCLEHIPERLQQLLLGHPVYIIKIMKHQHTRNLSILKSMLANITQD